jgi:hypothetical protein
MPGDIREKPSITHADVTSLNFIRSTPSCVFRRHYRQGLRSHIMEILNPYDVQKEQTGVFLDGIRWFPKAVPRKMFRIFRTRLKTLDGALNEIARVKLVERYLAPDFMATSTECIVDYQRPDGCDLLLCGFQEYVKGEVLDPWTVLVPEEILPTLYETINGEPSGFFRPKEEWIADIQKKGNRFISKIKKMMIESGHIPDLAGTGNLIISVTGNILLVDINNISPVILDASIYLDDKGYPVCDKSIEALSLIEEKILGRPIDMDETIYSWFLAPKRRESVKAIEEHFWKMKKAPKKSDL